jgi:hypothetical protein
VMDAPWDEASDDYEGIRGYTGSYKGSGGCGDVYEGSGGVDM